MHIPSARPRQRLGLTGGVGALLGTALAFAVLALLLGSDPTLQIAVRESEPHPEARIPFEWIAPLAAMAGALVGLIFGTVNLVLSAIGGLVAGLLVGSGRSVTTQPLTY